MQKKVVCSRAYSEVDLGVRSLDRSHTEPRHHRQNVTHKKRSFFEPWSSRWDDSGSAYSSDERAAVDTQSEFRMHFLYIASPGASDMCVYTHALARCAMLLLLTRTTRRLAHAHTHTEAHHDLYTNTFELKTRQ